MLEQSIVNSEKSFVSPIPRFEFTSVKQRFRKILTYIFKFDYGSWYHTHIDEKNKLNFLMENLLLNRLTPS